MHRNVKYKNGKKVFIRHGLTLIGLSGTGPCSGLLEKITSDHWWIKMCYNELYSLPTSHFFTESRIGLPTFDFCGKTLKRSLSSVFKTHFIFVVLTFETEIEYLMQCNHLLKKWTYCFLDRYSGRQTASMRGFRFRSSINRDTPEKPLHQCAIVSIATSQLRAVGS